MLILTVLNVFVFLTRKETAALDCFTCRNVTSIGDCTTVKQCGNNEHCHIAEYFEPGGLKVYDLDCQPVSSCYNQEVSDDTSHNMDVELWTSCCSTDYCNKKFSKDGQPLKGMSEPVMECYSCTDIADPADCLEKSACKSGEVCITTEHLDSVGTSHFKLGCVPKNFCLNLGYYLPFGKRYSKRFELCRGCCDSSNLCNNQFCSKKLGLTGEKPLGSSIAAHPVGQGGVTTSAAAATCRSQSLYSCYSCAVISDPADCRTQTTCKQGEVCYTTEHIGSDGKSHYQMGCLPRKVCLTLGYNLPQSKRYAKRFELCRACCEGSDLCNDKFCSNTRGLTGEKPLDSNSTPFPLCSNVAASTTSTTPGTTFDIFSTYNLVVKPQNNFASKGSTAVFQCEFDPPVSGKVTLTWYFEELSGAKHEVYSETKDPPTLQYVVNGVSDSDIGLYICEATFGEHKWSATGTLLV